MVLLGEGMVAVGVGAGVRRGEAGEERCGEEWCVREGGEERCVREGTDTTGIFLLSVCLTVLSNAVTVQVNT